MIAVVLFLSPNGWGQTTKASPANKSSHSSPSSAAPTAVIDTTAGKITCTLFPDKAPIGVNNFVGLATGTKDWTNPVTHDKKHGVPLYDGTIFHRVIPGFMIHGGDPKGVGTGDAGYAFKNETSTDLNFDRPGRLAYANAGPDTNGSQFFITEAAYPSLNGGYTIFGQCDDASVEVVKQIARMGRDTNDRPYSPVKIKHITISKAGKTSSATSQRKPVARKKPADAAPANQQ
ncbi:MAG: peptidylprolyl isomerase [Acidobacteriales bacterium]|nr:peptidylprolyl isomerase [Terriglobales bacterium]